MFASLQLPPGMYANGTNYQSQGRYYDGNLVRFFEGQIGPVGGWRQKSETAITGKGREIVAWRDNSKQLWAGIGTESNLYAMTLSGVVHDITPAGFSAGNADAGNGGGYGTGVFGSGAYGLPIVSVNSIIPASVWSLDLWGENLVGVMSEDGAIYEWAPVPPALAVPIANAPTARAILVTGERILMALGADGDPRKVRWSDQEDNTQWTTLPNNYAGEFTLQTPGELLCGVKLPSGALLFTETDVHRAEFLGQPLVYGFPIAGEGAGAISQNSVVPIDGQVIWMGQERFYSYSGFINPISCDVSDRVFTDINRAQISKVSAFHNSAYGEIWWFYPSSAATENNRYVVFNYVENTWSTGEIERLSAVDLGPFQYPLMVADDGFVYEHEIGFNHQGAQAFLEGGPIELGEGDRVMHAHNYIPDQSTLGDITVTFRTRFYPHGAETVSVPYPASEKTDIRISGRQTVIRYDAAMDTDWRIGDNRVDVRVRGKR